MLMYTYSTFLSTARIPWMAITWRNWRRKGVTLDAFGRLASFLSLWVMTSYCNSHTKWQKSINKLPANKFLQSDLLGASAKRNFVINDRRFIFLLQSHQANKWNWQLRNKLSHLFVGQSFAYFLFHLQFANPSHLWLRCRLTTTKSKRKLASHHSQKANKTKRPEP